MKVYEPLNIKNDGKWYKEWEIPNEMPVPIGMISIVPSEELQFPKWDSMQGKWIEDKDSIIESFKQQIIDLQELVASVVEGGLSNE